MVIFHSFVCLPEGNGCWDEDIYSMGDLQDPFYGGTLVPNCWPYVVGIFPDIGLKNRPRIYGRYLQFRFLKWSLIY